MSNLGYLKGKSIIDLLWDDLDSTMDLLMEECDTCEKLAGAHSMGSVVSRDCEYFQINTVLEYSIDEYRGRAQGVAYALALMSNPYLRNVDEVRNLAKKRYDQRAAGKPMDPLKTSPDSVVGE